MQAHRRQHPITALCRITWPLPPPLLLLLMMIMMMMPTLTAIAQRHQCRLRCGQ